MSQYEHRIRHDYKPLPRRKPRETKLIWFASGLALPFAALLVASVMTGPGQDSQSPGISSSVATTTIDLSLPGLTGDTVDNDSQSSATINDDLLEPGDPGSSVISLEIRSGDTLDALFRRNGMNITDLHAMMRLPEAKRQLGLLHPGDKFTIVHRSGEILELHRRLDETSSLVITRDQAGFSARMLEHPIEVRIAHAHGRIESSLFETATTAGLSDQMTMSLAGIFAWDIDFVLDIRRGDEFIVLYEEIWQDGQYRRDGDVIAAEFINNRQTFRAVHFVAPNGEIGFFTPEGLSMRKAFLRAPVDFTRISSRFSPRRLHPIFRTVRPHRGVDYAAPRGTPVKAAGDGKVTSRGPNGGLGNAIVIQHGGNIETVYGHLSRFARASRVGARVKQGQIIGYVGQTGWATGPHLHYEYRINGVHRNPRTVPLPKAEPIRADYKSEFIAESEHLLAQLDVVKRSRMAITATPAP